MADNILPNGVGQIQKIHKRTVNPHVYRQLILGLDPALNMTDF